MYLCIFVAENDGPRDDIDEQSIDSHDEARGGADETIVLVECVIIISA